jgi:hypothetical protein
MIFEDDKSSYDQSMERIDKNKYSVFAAFLLLALGLLASRLQVEILPFLLDILDHGVVLGSPLFLGIDLCEGFGDLLKRLGDADSVFGTDLEKLHAFGLAKLFDFLLLDLSIFLLAIDLVA